MGHTSINNDKSADIIGAKSPTFKRTYKEVQDSNEKTCSNYHGHLLKAGGLAIPGSFRCTALCRNFITIHSNKKGDLVECRYEVKIES